MRPFLLRSLLFCLFVPVIACAAQDPEKMLRSLPMRIGECERDAKPKTFGKAEYGAGVTYRRDGFVASVYCYDLGEKAIGTSLDDATLNKAMDAAKREIATAQKQGSYSEVEEIDSGRTNFSKAHQVLSTRYRLTRTDAPGRGPLNSDIFIFGAGGNIVKVRITSSLDGEEQRTAVRQVMLGIMDALRRVELEKV